VARLKNCQLDPRDVTSQVPLSSVREGLGYHCMESCVHRERADTQTQTELTRSADCGDREPLLPAYLIINHDTNYSSTHTHTIYIYESEVCYLSHRLWLYTSSLYSASFLITPHASNKFLARFTINPFTF
jgi:hypothetical protein